MQLSSMNDGAMSPWLPERKKKMGQRSRPGRREGHTERGVEKDGKECTCVDDAGVPSPAFLNQFNNEYLEPSLRGGAHGIEEEGLVAVVLAGEVFWSAEQGLLVLVVVEGDRRGSSL
jgi:hypothetical protein